MAALVNLFKMFDKIDDIVYEPVKMVCDLCRQPIRNAEAANERKNMETEARLQQQMKEYELELNLKRHQKELDIEANNRRINAEIDDMIARNELERQSMVVEAIKKYQEDLGRVSVELSNSIGKMSLEIRERTHALVIEKTKEYVKIQNEIQDRASDRLEQLEQRFPNGGRSKEIMENAVEKQLMSLLDISDKFMIAMKDDIANMTENINQITAQAVANTDKYLSPMMARALSDGPMRKTEIEYTNKKYIE